MVFSTGALHPTRAALRKPTIKSNPFETQPGKYDQSFEKMTETIESRLPFRQRHMQHGSLYDRLYGEKTEEEENQVRDEDMYGHEFERPAQRAARQYLGDGDLLKEEGQASAARAAATKRLRVKAAEAHLRRPYDKNAAKRSSEPEEYYYPSLTLEQKRRRQAVRVVLGGAGVAAAYEGWKRLSAYMRSNEY